MKIYTYKNEIYSLEQVVHITQQGNTLRVHHSVAYDDYSMIRFDSEEDLAKGAKEITNILRGVEDNDDLIIFGDTCFRKKNFVSARLSIGHIYVTISGGKGDLVELNISTSEKRAKEWYKELLALVK